MYIARFEPEEQDLIFTEGIRDIAPYAAGIVDGEGCIDIQRQKTGRRGHFARVSVRNTYRLLLDWFVEQFGGDVQSSKPARLIWKQSFCWRLSGPAAEAFLYIALPWLIVKKQQALLALQLPMTKEYESIRRKVGAYRRLTVASLLAGEDLRLRMKQLNRKGVPV